jgi:putative transposase
MELEVMPDHVPILIEVDPQFGVAKIIRLMKGRSSRYMRRRFPGLRKIKSLWTNSYYVTTVGGAPLEVVKQYIRNQKK